MTSKLKNKFQTIPPGDLKQQTKTSELAGLALNYNKHLVVGDVANQYISIHKQSGDHVHSFKVTMNPWFICAAPGTDIIVVSNCGGHTTQIMTSNGQHLHTISSAPVPGKSWYPTGACFNGDDEFLIASQYEMYLFSNTPGGIYHYSTNGKYLGCITSDVQNVTDVAITKEGKLFVLEHTHIKIFKKK